MDKTQQRAETNRQLETQRQAVIAAILQRQADAIDAALAGLDLVGRVTGGDVTGNAYGPTHARYLWEPSNGRPTFDQAAQLAKTLPTGATWSYQGGGKLLVTMPLATIEPLGDANTYETEKRLYCPCGRRGGDCFLKRSHHLDDLRCDYTGGD